MIALRVPGRFRTSILFLLALSGFCGGFIALGEVRTWTRTDGKTVEAELVGVEKDKAKLKLSDGNVYEFPMLGLSLADQEYAAKWLDERNSPAAGSATSGPSFPLPDPSGYPALPKEPCRIVIVRLPGASSELPHGGFDKVASDDYADVVQLGEAMQGANVLAIRQDGGVNLWRADGEKIVPRGADAVVAYDSGFRSQLVWVASDGSLQCESENRDFEREVRRIKDVVRLRAYGWGLFAISADGTRHLVSGRIGPVLEEAGVDVQELMDVSSLIGNGFWALLRDGTLLSFDGTGLKTKSDPGSYVALPHSHIQRRVNGKFDGFAMAHAFAAGLDYDPASTPEIHVGGGAGAHRTTPAGEWEILLQDPKWLVDSRLMQAFGDAADLHIQESLYLYALLPAESVPRSGLWDLDELIAARAALAK